MIGIVQSDADEFPNSSGRLGKAHTAFHQRQAFGFEGA